MYATISLFGPVNVRGKKAFHICDCGKLGWNLSWAGPVKVRNLIKVWGPVKVRRFAL